MFPRATAMIVVSLALVAPACGTKSRVWIDPGDPPQAPDSGDSDTDVDVDSDTDTDADAGSDAGCQSLGRELAPEPVLLLVMLDRSSSMASSMIGYHTHAEIAAAALTAMVGEHDGTDLIHFGLGVFPSLACEQGGEDTDAICDPSTAEDNPVVNFGPETFEAFATALDVIGSCGGTPACYSLMWAHAQLVSLELLEAYPGIDRRVLLIMDGTPNCNPDWSMSDCLCPDDECYYPIECVDDMCTYEAVLQLACAEAPVYVVGLGDEPAEWGFVFDGIAAYGDTNEAWLADGPAELDYALGEIADEVVSCQLVVGWDQVPAESPSPPHDPIDRSCDALNLVAETIGEGEQFELCYMPDCSWEAPQEGVLGWHYEEVAGEQEEIGDLGLEECAVVQLCPQACEDLVKGELALFTGEFGCEPGCY